LTLRQDDGLRLSDRAVIDVRHEAWREVKNFVVGVIEAAKKLRFKIGGHFLQFLGATTNECMGTIPRSVRKCGQRGVKSIVNVSIDILCGARLD